MNDDEYKTASGSMELVTGISFEAAQADAIDTVANLFISNPELWEAFRKLIDATLTGEIEATVLPTH